MAKTRWVISKARLRTDLGSFISGLSNIKNPETRARYVREWKRYNQVDKSLVVSANAGTMYRYRLAVNIYIDEIGEWRHYMLSSTRRNLTMDDVGPIQAALRRIGSDVVITELEVVGVYDNHRGVWE